MYVCKKALCGLSVLVIQYVLSKYFILKKFKYMCVSKCAYH